MNSFIKSSALLAVTAAITFTVASAASAASSKGDYNGQTGAGISAGGKSEPDSTQLKRLTNNGYQVLVRRYNPNRPFYGRVVEASGESCAYLYHRINRDNALATVPEYRKCLETHQTR